MTIASIELDERLHAQTQYMVACVGAMRHGGDGRAPGRFPDLFSPTSSVLVRFVLENGVQEDQTIDEVLSPAAPSTLHWLGRRRNDAPTYGREEFFQDLFHPLVLMSHQLIEFAHGSDTPPPSETKLRWLFERMATSLPSQDLIDDPSWACLALCHQIAQWQWAAWNRNAPVALSADDQTTLRHLLKMAKEDTISTGCKISQVLAVEGVRLLMRAFHRNSPRDALSAFDGTWDQLDPTLARLLLDLFQHNDLARRVSPTLAHRIPPPQKMEFRLVEKTQEKLTSLAEFSASLFDEALAPNSQRAKLLAAKRPMLEMGDVAEHEVEKFSCLRSFVQDDHDALRELTLQRLTATEEAVFFATLTPRPTLFHEFMKWNRSHAFLPEDTEFPMGDQCLKTLVFAYNVLAVHTSYHYVTSAGARALPSSWDEARKTRARQAWRRAIEILGKAPVPLNAIGDAFGAFLALEGLRGPLAEQYHLNASTATDWSGIIAHLETAAPELLDPLTSLAAASPVTLLASDNWGRRLEELQVHEDLQVANIGPFLANLKNAPLAQFLAERFATRLLGNIRLLGGVSGDLLAQSIEGDGVAGPEFAMSVFENLLLPTFNECNRNCSALAASRRGNSTEEISARRHFAASFLDHSMSHTRRFFQLMTRLHQRIAEMGDRLPRTADADERKRVEAVQRRWRAMCGEMTRPFVHMPWKIAAARLLRMFWLNFLIASFEAAPGLPTPLGVDSPKVNDPGGFISWLVASLRKSITMHNERLRLAKEQGGGAARIAGAEQTTVQSEDLTDKAELKVIDEAVGRVLKHRHMKNVLIASRLLVRATEGKGLVWNGDRLDELASQSLRG